MKAWPNPARFQLKLLISMLLLLASSSALLSCAPQPKSMFEQKAEADAANKIEIATPSKIDDQVALDPSIVASTSDDEQLLSIDIGKQQAIARQPDCDRQVQTCQYLELNILKFTPDQPWLTGIMWQTIARVLSPKLPFTSQEQVAKDSIAAILKQIEFTNQGVSSQPLYQRIDTELVLNQNAKNAPNTGTDHILTGYLLVKSTQHPEHKQQQFDYVMLDIHKKLQLNIEDILLPTVTSEQLLLALQTAKREWLSQKGVENQYLQDWPLALSKQWYLDERGLHMIYQGGALLNTELEAVDLLVATEQLTALAKPSYIIGSKKSLSDEK